MNHNSFRHFTRNNYYKMKKAWQYTRNSINPLSLWRHESSKHYYEVVYGICVLFYGTPVLFKAKNCNL